MVVAQEPRSLGTEVHLRRFDASRNMARYYTVSVEVALFETWACTRSFGRVGRKGGRVMVGLYPDEAQAVAALGALLRQKQRKGYRPAGSIPPTVALGSRIGSFDRKGPWLGRAAPDRPHNLVAHARNRSSSPAFISAEFRLVVQIRAKRLKTG